VREFERMVGPCLWLCPILEVSWFVEVEVNGFLLVGKMKEMMDERDALYALQVNRADMTVHI
jgi:hypothetical protein